MLKTLDILASALLVIGGLNWGLVGVFNFNLVTAIFGEGSLLSRLVFTVVGLAAVYQVAMIKKIWKRWNVQLHEPAHA
jgi:uncharacterized membrane protein YuzA (DUF378 family)